MSPHNENEKILHFWKSPEKTKYDHPVWWRGLFLLVCLGMIVRGIHEDSWLIILSFVLFPVVYYFEDQQKIREKNIFITDLGVWLDDNEFYQYNDIRSYWFTYKVGKIEQLHLDVFVNKNEREIIIDIKKTNIVQVRDILNNYIPLAEGKKEKGHHSLIRWLRL